MALVYVIFLDGLISDKCDLGLLILLFGVGDARAV